MRYVVFWQAVTTVAGSEVIRDREYHLDASSGREAIAKARQIIRNAGDHEHNKPRIQEYPR